MNFGFYRSFVVYACVFIFFTNFSDFSQRYGLIPLFWIVALGGMAAPLMIPALFGSRLRVPPLAIWGAGFLLVTIAWYYPIAQTEKTFQNMQTRVLSIMFLGLMLFVFSMPEYQRKARVAIVWAVLLGVVLNLYELFNPMTFSTVPGRSSGLYTNVNQSGAALVLGMIIGYAVVPRRFQMPFMVLTAMGILTTFSRAAMIGWVIVILYVAARGGLGFVQLRRIFGFCALVFMFILSPWWAGLQQTLEDRGTLTLDVVQRLNFLGGGANTSDASSQERSAVAKFAWDLFKQAPLLGHGTGEHRQLEGWDVSTHNIYLAMMVDHGFLGALVLPLMVLAIGWGFPKRQRDLIIPFGSFLLLWGMFSHNVLEERYILVSVALVSSIVWSERARVAEEESLAESLSPAPIGPFPSEPVPNMTPLGAPA